MMGHQQVEQAALFYEFSLERHVPTNHLSRAQLRQTIVIGISVLRLSLLFCLLLRAVAAVVAAGGGTHRAMAGIVASDATGDGAFNAAFGIGG
jgi:hypothetical protein